MKKSFLVSKVERFFQMEEAVANTRQKPKGAVILEMILEYVSANSMYSLVSGT